MTFTRSASWAKALMAFGLVALFFTGCSSAPRVAQTCQELDWYELGRQDGSKGHTFGRTIKPLCTDTDSSLAEALYNNGYDAGLAQYCVPANGFELGRSGVQVADVCPALMRDAFLKRYKQGQRFSEIEQKQKAIEARLARLDPGAITEPLALTRRGLISAERIELLEQKKSLEAEISRLTLQARF